jgi:hypothetical protein
VVLGGEKQKSIRIQKQEEIRSQIKEKTKGSLLITKAVIDDYYLTLFNYFCIDGHVIFWPQE